MYKSLVIIPCYNEGKRLEIVVFEEFLKNNSTFALLFVNDGSTDDTLKIISTLERIYTNAYSLNLENNQGKAEAVRKGINFSLSSFKFKYIGFFDADLAMPLDTLLDLENSLEKQNFKMVIGTRFKRLGAKIERSGFRHFFGRIFATAAANVLKMDVYDTQCGAKLMTKEIAEIIFQDIFISRWLFDIELLARIKNSILQGQDFILEYPLKEWKEIEGSKIKITDVFRFPYELLKIRKLYFKK
jgi:glycosyltransferase involved in cell wall biosynthesis